MTRFLDCYGARAGDFTTGCEEQPQGANTTTAQQAAAQQTAASPTAALPQLPAGKELVTLTLTLPPASEKSATEALSGHGDSCPQSRVSGLLGVEITSPHGVMIGKSAAGRTRR